MENSLKYGEANQRFNEFLENAQGIFFITDVYNWTGIKSPKGQDALRRAIFRAKREGIIETAGSRAGCYRKIEKSFDAIDLRNIKNTDPLSVRLPLGLDDFVQIYPKDIIVFAGVPNQGKTALLLESARLNMEKWKIFYFSSEMSARTAAMRISKHCETSIESWKFNFVDSFANYKDVVQPDDLNIFDYIEEPEGEYFKIPSYISGIHKALHNGIAFLAIQKNPGTLYGTGGPQTLAKPSVFCALENNICTVLKAKNFNHINPYKYKAKFKIYNGINISRVGMWEPP